MITPEEQARIEQLESMLAAAREHWKFQQAREAKHEQVRRSHRITALAGGGERECARRRRQYSHLMDKWAHECVAPHEVMRRVARRIGG